MDVEDTETMLNDTKRQRQEENESKLARNESGRIANSVQTTTSSVDEHIIAEEKKAVVAPVSTSVVEGDLTPMNVFFV